MPCPPPRLVPPPRRGRASRGGLPLAVLLTACRPAPPPTAPGDPAAITPTDPPPPAAVDPTPDDPPPCGPTGERFDEHTWAPETAPAVASIQLDAPDLPAALQHLAEHVRGSGHGLPIPLAFSLGQWSWQIPTVVATLRQAGFRPAQLVFVAGDDADHAWVWRSTCDLDEAIERIQTAWSVRPRRTVEGLVATPTAPEGDAPSFPYDVLVLPGQRMALVPAGRAQAVLDRFARPAPRLGLGVAPLPTAGRRLDELAPAPIRLSFVGRALLDPDAPTTAHQARALRVTAQGVQPDQAPAEDASLPRPLP